jgi:hypothetical protein
MDIEKGLEMSGYSLMEMGGVASLTTPETHKKSKLGWHKAMLARDDFDPEDDDEYLKKSQSGISVSWQFLVLLVVLVSDVTKFFL